jgi:hypothetical protein
MEGEDVEGGIEFSEKGGAVAVALAMGVLSASDAINRDISQTTVLRPSKYIHTS